jgi:ABC-type Na+ efflux pump permease subunit
MLTVALREYRAMVATKAFMLSLVVMPLLMFGGILALNMMNRLTKSETLKLAIWDPEDLFFSELQVAAEARRIALDGPPLNGSALDDRAMAGQVLGSDSAAKQAWERPAAAGDDLAEGAAAPGREPLSAAGASAPGAAPINRPVDDGGPLGDNDRFLLVRLTDAQLDDERRLALSAQVQRKELHAFVEIPPELRAWLQDLPLDGKTSATPPLIQFYSESSGLDPARRWLGETLNQLAKNRRFERLGLRPHQVALANQPVPVRSLGLVTQRSDGSVTSEESRDTMTALFLPMGMMMLMFMVIMMAAQPMLETVLEEKSLRIAEVLLGSCNPTQLMLGKLLGTVAGSLTIFSFYLIGAIFFAWNQDLLDRVPLSVLPWFFLFQLLAVLFYSSIFMAIGVSVSQLKDAQPMMMPVWMMLMLPLMTWFVLVQKPDGPFAFWLSMFPPTASTVMVLRISTGITVPLWQILLSLGILVAATGLVVYLAGRIFRIGLLWQGKAPKLADLVGWAFARY